MNTAMVKGILIGGLVTVGITAGGMVGYQAYTQPKYAEVLAVKPVSETIKQAREECRDVAVQRKAPVKDENRIAGTVIGGVAGGLLGNQIGGGNGKKVATVAGAVAGGYAGNRVQKNLQENDVVTTTEQRCKTVQQKSQRLVGYDVTYRLNGQEGKTRTSFEPGATLPVKDGQVVTTPPPTAARS